MNKVYIYFNALSEFENIPELDSQYRFSYYVHRILFLYTFDNKDLHDSV